MEMTRNARLNPVLYSMGKVASTSISSALTSSGMFCPDIHTLNESYLIRTASQFLNDGEFPNPHLSFSMALRHSLKVRAMNWLFISLVRDPVARNLSAFFENFNHYNRSRGYSLSTETQLIFDNFVECYQHDFPISWFDREYRDELGIDIFEFTFDKERRYAYYPSINTLLFRVDCPDATKTDVLSRVLGVKIELLRKNVGKNKAYREVYRGVRDHASFSSDLLDRLYDSRFAKHFWTKEELGKLRDTWSSAKKTT